MAPFLAQTLLEVGLLDPVSAATGCRLSEDMLLILGSLASVPAARVSCSVTQPPCSASAGHCACRNAGGCMSVGDSWADADFAGGYSRALARPHPACFPMPLTTP